MNFIKKKEEKKEKNPIPNPYIWFLNYGILFQALEKPNFIIPNSNSRTEHLLIVVLMDYWG